MLDITVSSGSVLGIFVNAILTQVNMINVYATAFCSLTVFLIR